MRLSVVIANYNYARFVPAAIDSALDLDLRGTGLEVEVIVVDDGSTDHSAEVIGGYGERIRAVFAENAGQRTAANHGFALSTGDAVLFLDADDVLPSGLPAALVEVWTPEVSKVQFQMQRIDATGEPIGQPFPDYRPVPDAERLREWLSRTSAYPTPPGSGNVYARWFLDRICPVGPEAGEFLDSALLAAAPLHGDVIAVPAVLIGYRRHDDNDSALVARPDRFAREIARARDRWRYALSSGGSFSSVASSVAPSGGDASAADAPAARDAALFRSRELLQFRVANARLGDGPSPLPGDGRRRLLADVLRAPLHPGPESAAKRLLITAWCLATLVAPQRLARPLVTRRYGRSG